jgi:very-short-patch-repair endonuclease
MYKHKNYKRKHKFYSDYLGACQNSQRLNPPHAEIRFMQICGQNEIGFIHQFILGNYVYDFLLKKFKLIIEIDGKWTHNSFEQKTKDSLKEDYAKRAGYKFLRITNLEVFNDSQIIVEKIENAIRDYQNNIGISEPQNLFNT